VPSRALGLLAGAALPACLLAGLLGCRGEDPDAVFLVGTVERTLVEVVAPGSETIEAIEVARGERVAAGRTLVRLNSLLAEADLATAEAELARAQAAHTVADHDHERARQLHRDRVASEQQLERARLSLDEAAAAWRAAAARTAAARKRLADLTLRAPVSGVVDQLPFDPGERVPAGAVVAVLLADGAPWVRVWIPERAVARVGPGDGARVHVDGIGPLAGRVLDVSREAAYTPHYALTERERVHLVYEARVEIEDAPPELRPGVPAEVRIALPARAPAAAPP
jgi:HlyD family secretion protein